ncbi:MAG: hypothetical protein ACRCV9_13655 [Burkholderiaceae bacterium]
MHCGAVIESFAVALSAAFNRVGPMIGALLGGNLAKLGADNGWAGIIVFGAVRDADEIDACNLVVRCIATCPQPTVKKGEGAVNVPVEIAGLRIEAGQWLYEDRDGILISHTAL